MKIFCVYSVEEFSSLDRPLSSFAEISYGLSFIATVLKDAGHDVRILVCPPRGKGMERVLEVIGTERPDILCLTAVTSRFPRIREIAARAKERNPAIRAILGGHHATLNPEATIREPCFDALCVGEGEEAILSYVDQVARGKHPADIPNLWIRDPRTGAVERNAQSAFLQNLDGLPFIDRSLWDGLVADRNRMHTVLVGRGCPNRCTYCSNHALCRTGTGRYVRFRSPENVVAELSEICGRYEVPRIRLEAETLSVNIAYTLGLCGALEAFNAKRATPVSFETNLSMTRAIVGNRELLGALRRANVRSINIGLESGSERVRNEILRRPRHSNADIVEFCALVREYGIYVNLYVLIGIPGETLSDYRQTIDCVRRCAPEHAFVSIFYPYPGTDLYEAAKGQGLLPEDIVDPELERRKATLDLPGFPRKRIQREYVLFPYHAYRGNKSALRIGAHLLYAYVSVHPLLSRLYRYAVRNPVVGMLHRKVVRIGI